MVGRHLELPFRQQLTGAVRPVLGGALVLAAAAALGARWQLDSWLLLAPAALVSGGVALIVTLGFCFGPTRRRSLLARFGV
jgi:hypothetical protein